MMLFKHNTYSMAVLFLLQVLVTVGVSGHCSSPTLSSPALASMLSRSHILVKASVEKIRADHSATIKIVDVYKGSEKIFTHELESGAGVSVRHQVLGWPGSCSGLSRGSLVLLDLEQTPASGLRVRSLYLFTPNIETLIISSSLGWGAWSDWSSCSASCDAGVQHRYRLCFASSEETCRGRRKEGRVCNTFSCSGALNALGEGSTKYFKPHRRQLARLSDRHQGWGIRAGSYFLIPFRQAFGADFPQDWTIFLSFKTDSSSQGVIFSLTDPAGKEENLSLNIAADSRSDARSHDGNLYLKIIHWSSNNTRSVTIPTYLKNNTWTQLAISIEGGRTIKTYLDCAWVTTQIMDGHSFRVTPNPDLVIGYMMQTEIDQMTITSNPADVGEQCSVTTRDADTGQERHMRARRNHDDEGSGDSSLEASGAQSDEEPDTGSGMYELEWSGWSPCSLTCGGLDSVSIQSRWSRCVDSDVMMDCIKAGGERKETRTCSLRPCHNHHGQEGHHHHDLHHGGGHEGHQGGHEATHIHQGDIDKLRRGQIEREEGPPHCSCHNGGHCSATPPYPCVCRSGWAGLLCDTPTCDPPCAHGGVCVRPDVCACQPGYTGSRCEDAACHPPCQHGGQCTEPFTCSCPAGYSGRFCQKCTGPSCSTDKSLSGTGPACLLNCQNGGTCNHNMTKCNCKRGFYGDFCQKMSCHSYVRVKEPHVTTYRKTLRRGNLTEYKTFFRTVYTSTTRCREDVKL